MYNIVQLIIRDIVHYILFLLLTLTISVHADNLNIVTSTNHLASLTNMIVRDTNKISVISNTGSCPEHYHLKPSDIEKVKNADLVIYIDDKFENFIVNILPKHKKNILKISDLKSIYVENNNWHIWLDIENTKLILARLSSLLSEIDYLNKKLWQQNLELSKNDLQELEEYKNKKFSKLGKVILISDSLEYLFRNTTMVPEKLYLHPGMISLKTLSKLSNIDPKTCIIASNSEGWDEFERKITHKIVRVDSEKWSKNYLEHYRGIIDIVGNECNN